MRRIKPYLKFIFSRSAKITIDSIPDGSILDIGGGGKELLLR